MNKKISIGEFGEKLVKHLFEKRGSTVVLSSDQFDMNKDLTIDGIETEIKTQTPFYCYKNPSTKKIEESFTVPITTNTSLTVYNQLSKVLNVQQLIFVELPKKNNYIIRIFKAPDLGKRCFTVTQNEKDSRFIAAFPISEMTQLFEFDASNHKEFIDKTRITLWSQH